MNKNDSPIIGQAEEGEAQSRVFSNEKSDADRESNRVSSQSPKNRDKKENLIVSERKAEANRRNAKRSTGPRTDRGKRAVSMNAVKHGFYSKAPLIPHPDAKEDQAAFDALCADVTSHYQPASWYEKFLVQQVAAFSWRFQRSVRGESGIIAKAMADYCSNSAAILKENFTNEESAASGSTALITDHLLVPPKEDLDGLLRYQAMLHRQQNQTIAELERVQGLRTEKTKPVLN